MKRFVCIAAILGIVALNFVVPSPTDAHGVFKKHLEAKYKTESHKLMVTCNACHVKGEPKTERSDFGDLFAAEFKGMDLSKKWDSYEDDLDEREKFEQETMIPAFKKAWTKISEQELKEGEGKIKDLLGEGKISGTKKKALKKK